MKDTVLWKVWLVLFKVYTVKSGSVEDKWPPYTLYWNLEVVDSFNLIFWDHIFATSKYCQISSIDLCSKINKPSLLSKLWKKKTNKPFLQWWILMWIRVQGLHLSWFVKFQLLPISWEKPNESCLICVVMDDDTRIMGVSISRRRRPLFIQGSPFRCLKHCYQLGPW